MAKGIKNKIGIKIFIKKNLQVFSDQKQSVKRKFLYNKSSLKKTEGGPYKEKILNSVEEQILEAAGIAVAVDGLTKITVHGSKPDLPPEDLETSFFDAPPQDLNSSFLYVFDSDEDDSNLQHPEKKPKLQIPEILLKNKSSKTNFKENLKYADEFYKQLFDKIDSLIELKKKTVAIKEAEHNINMEIKRIELQIKIKELEKLN